MTGLDTNVLVRYLVKDDPAQAAAAASFIKERLQSDEKLYVNTIVLCETLWVLRSAYGHTEEQLREVVSRLLQARLLILEDEALLHRVLLESDRTGVPIVDCLIGRRNEDAGCKTTVTFDSVAGTSPAFLPL